MPEGHEIESQYSSLNQRSNVNTDEISALSEKSSTKDFEIIKNLFFNNNNLEVTPAINKEQGTKSFNVLDKTTNDKVVVKKRPDNKISIHSDNDSAGVSLLADTLQTLVEKGEMVNPKINGKNFVKVINLYEECKRRGINTVTLGDDAKQLIRIKAAEGNLQAKDFLKKHEKENIIPINKPGKSMAEIMLEKDIAKINELMEETELNYKNIKPKESSKEELESIRDNYCMITYKANDLIEKNPNMDSKTKKDLNSKLVKSDVRSVKLTREIEKITSPSIKNK